MSQTSSGGIGPRYYEALGRMLVEFQALEETITFALLRLTRENVTEDIDIHYLYALSELSFKAKLKLLRNYAESAKVEAYLYAGSPSEKERPEFFKQILEALKRDSSVCDAIEDKRNQYIHSVWAPSESDPEGTARRFKLRVQAKRASLLHVDVPVSALEDFVAHMAKVRDGINGYSEILANVLFEKRRNEA